MRKTAAFLLFLASCAPERTWESRVEEPEMPPLPAEKILRRPADFRVHDVPNRREYFLYVYGVDEMNDLRIFAIDHAQPRSPRQVPSDGAEYAAALDLFSEKWQSLPDEERLGYFNRLHEQEMRRNATLLDEQIHYKTGAIRRLEEEKFLLECDLKSDSDANVQVKPEKVTALQAEIAEKARQIRVHGAQVHVLEFRRDLRNSEFGSRRGRFVSATIKVDDLIIHYSGPQRLVDDIREHVASASWGKSIAAIEIAEGSLTVRNTSEIVDEVAAFLNSRRAEFKEKAAQQAPK